MQCQAMKKNVQWNLVERFARNKDIYKVLCSRKLFSETIKATPRQKHLCYNNNNTITTINNRVNHRYLKQCVQSKVVYRDTKIQEVRHYIHVHDC